MNGITQVLYREEFAAYGIWEDEAVGAMHAYGAGGIRKVS
jgi:hypothetical protein